MLAIELRWSCPEGTGQQNRDSERRTAMWEKQTIVKKGDKVEYLTETADIEYYIFVLDYQVIGTREVLDGKVISQEMFDTTPHKVPKVTFAGSYENITAMI